MSEQYNLVFRGECLDGTDPATVQAKVGQVLKVQGAQLQLLFSGKPVALKRGVDKATAARFQQALRQAGARLRVVPVAEADQAAVAATPAAPTAPATPTAPSPAAPASPAAEAPGTAPAGDGQSGLAVAPVGGDLLRPEERRSVTPAAVATSHLSVAPVGSLEDVVPARSAPPAPDTSHLSVAEAGADLGPDDEHEVAAVAVPDLDLAPPGADLEQLPDDRAPVQVDVSGLDLAPPGEDLAPPAAAPPAAPDTSHLDVERSRAQFALPDD